MKASNLLDLRRYTYGSSKMSTNGYFSDMIQNRLKMQRQQIEGSEKIVDSEAGADI